MKRIHLDSKNIIISLYTEIFGPDNSRILKMALDTGATYTLIPHHIAIGIGYDHALSNKRIEIITPSGIEFIPIIRVNSIKCLGFEVRNIEVGCHTLPPRSPVEGLLGLNFLRNFNVFLKFLEEILEVNNK